MFFTKLIKEERNKQIQLESFCFCRFGEVGLLAAGMSERVCGGKTSNCVLHVAFNYDLVARVMVHLYIKSCCLLQNPFMFQIDSRNLDPIVS